MDHRWSTWTTLRIIVLDQWFSSFTLKGAKSRLTTMLKGRTKEILTQVTRRTLIYRRTKSVTQNIESFVERLLMTAQRVLGAACGPQNSG